MQAVKIETEEEITVGTSTRVKNIFNLPEDFKIFWAGSRIYAKRPCGRDIVVSKVDIFCEGQLQKGEYIREKGIPISSRVPPTVKERNLTYRVRSEISMIKPGTRAGEEFFFSENPIVLKSTPMKISESNPVEVSLTGIKIKMEKDQFIAGETIKIDYELEKVKDLEVDLVKDANVTCNCPDYAPTCIHIKPKPPSVEHSVKASNLTKGTLQLILPTYIEQSHRYIWEPPEKTRWKETYGDYVNWVLNVIGTRTSGEVVKFQIPISILGKPLPEEAKFFSSEQVKAPLLKKIIVPDAFQITNQTLENKRIIITLSNNSKEILKGVTVKIIPIESEFFELPPNLTGINEWVSNTEIQAYHNNIGKNIKTLQITIEDNSGNSINKRLNL
ncbi:MAG TPA: hypothetical protein VMV49_02720 [Candidatus Deferrimicrobium sp.]|nr:hypothetical protein [Candidatus Deferrimicrobium sp.]